VLPHTATATIYLTFCSCIYRICSDTTRGKYEYGTKLQIITQLILSKFIAVYTKYVAKQHKENMNIEQQK